MVQGTPALDRIGGTPLQTGYAAGGMPLLLNFFVWLTLAETSVYIEIVRPWSIHTGHLHMILTLTETSLVLRSTFTGVLLQTVYTGSSVSTQVISTVVSLCNVKIVKINFKLND